mgnify:FL=1
MMTTGHTPSEGFPLGGGEAAETSDTQAFDYLQEPDTSATQDGSGPEDPRRREARLSRRRRLLKIGGVPAALAAIISLWLGSIFLISLAGNRAAAAGHYDTALSRYRMVARINPWLEQWRVYFNLGTGQLAAKDPTSAVTTLNTALTRVPKAKTDPQTKAKQADSPECKVRTNLYVAHLMLASQADQGGNSTSAAEHIEAAKKAADTCAVPPPPEQDPPTSPPPSATPSSDPSSTPSSETSSSPSSNPSPTPSSDPSATPSSDPSTTPSSDPSSSASSSPGETASSSPSTKPSPTPADDRAKRLRDRNNGGEESSEKPGGSGGGGKPW